MDAVVPDQRRRPLGDQYRADQHTEEAQALTPSPPATAGDHAPEQSVPGHCHRPPEYDHAREHRRRLPAHQVGEQDVEVFRQEEGVIEQGLLRHRRDADRTDKLKQDHDTPDCRHQPSERSAPAASPEEQQEPHHDEQVSGVDDPEVWIEGQRHQQCRGQSSEHDQQQEHGW